MAETNSIKLLREQMGEDYKVIRAMADKINAESRDFTAEETEVWDKANDAYTSKEKRVLILERANAVEAKMAAAVEEARSIPPQLSISNVSPQLMEAAQGGSVQALAFGAWARYQNGIEISEKEQEAARVCGVNPRSSTYTIQRPIGMRHHDCWSTAGPMDFGANLSQFTPTTGGYTVPETFVRSLEIALLQYGGVRQVAQVITTSDGSVMTWPAADDTSNQGSQIGESATQTTTTTTSPAFKAKVWTAYGYTSNFILVPFGLLRDSAFNLAQVVGTMLGERVGRKTNAHFTTGDGAGKPSGITTDSTLGVTTASATAIAADELYDLEHSVDPAYRSMGCGWMFHDTILKGLRKLKDGQSRYLWQEGMSVGAPNMLLGYPYAISQEMASSIAASAITVLFGLLSAYKIRDVGGIRLNRVNERFVETDNVGFNAISYHDGHLLDAGTHPVKNMTQHS